MVIRQLYDGLKGAWSSFSGSNKRRNEQVEALTNLIQERVGPLSLNEKLQLQSELKGALKERISGTVQELINRLSDSFFERLALRSESLYDQRKGNRSGADAFDDEFKEENSELFPHQIDLSFLQQSSDRSEGSQSDVSSLSMNDFTAGDGASEIEEESLNSRSFRINTTDSVESGLDGRHIRELVLARFETKIDLYSKEHLLKDLKDQTQSYSDHVNEVFKRLIDGHKGEDPLELERTKIFLEEVAKVGKKSVASQRDAKKQEEDLTLDPKLFIHLYEALTGSFHASLRQGNFSPQKSVLLHENELEITLEIEEGFRKGSPTFATFQRLAENLLAKGREEANWE